MPPSIQDITVSINDAIRHHQQCIDSLAASLKSLRDSTGNGANPSGVNDTKPRKSRSVVLPETVKRIIELASQGLTQKEIATQTGLSVATVAKRLKNY